MPRLISIKVGMGWPANPGLWEGNRFKSEFSWKCSQEKGGIVNFIQKSYPQISDVKNIIQKFYPKNV